MKGGERWEGAEKMPSSETSGKIGVITMIYGGPIGGDSNRSRKASAREIQMLEKHEVLRIEGGLSPPEISFGIQDADLLIILMKMPCLSQ